MAQNPQPLEDLRAEVLRMLDTMDPNAAIAATVVLKVRQDKRGTFERLIADLARATLRMPGVVVFDYYRHKSIRPEVPRDDAVQYLIYENWESTSLFRAQWNSDHLKSFQVNVMELVADAPDLNFYYGSANAKHAYVLQTGQKRCWDSDGSLIRCEGTGQDGHIRAGEPDPHPRFADNNDGTVTDNLTGLVWLKNANLFGEVSWDQALVNANGLASGSCGLSDRSQRGEWRLPNINEFQSLLDLDNSSGPAITPDHPFINLRPANYWSSTSVALAPPLGWFTALAVGPPVFDLKVNWMRMWPVRGGKEPRIAQTGQKRCFDSFGQPIACGGTGQDADVQAGVPVPTPRFTDNGDGTVTDLLTRLIWLKNANAFDTKTWSQALAACNSLASGMMGLSDRSQVGDWRLPNVFELRSLMDYSTFNPALPADHPFLNVSPSLYWSSTTVASAPNLARFVFVGIGPSVWDHKNVLLRVWPVRGGRRRHHV